MVKRLYYRTNKNKPARQIARQERRSTRLRRAREAAARPSIRHLHHVPFSASDPLPHTAVDQHHHMSDTRNFPHHLMTFASNPAGDPARIVGPSSVLTLPSSCIVNNRTLSLNSKATCWAGFWIAHLMMMNSRLSQLSKDPQCASSMTAYMPPKSCE